MPLRIAFKNEPAINRDADPVFRNKANEMLKEILERDRLKAEKKYGIAIPKITLKK
jgi:hypothetical protein